jgi:TPR repeat protein
LGLLTDEDEALKWNREAAKGGNGYAQRRLGWAYEKGELGVEIDLAAARVFYQEAAQGGDGYAQCRLAEANVDGE